MQVLIRFDECVLREVLGVVPVAGELEKIGKNPLFIAGHKLAERIRQPAPGFLNQPGGHELLFL
jgi:hypothetical protein